MEELEAMFCEAIFNQRWQKLEDFHAIGKFIIKHKLDIEKLPVKASQRPRTAHYAVELAKAYPNLNSLPDGKNASWYKIMKILPPYEKKPAKKEKRPKKRK